MKFLSRYKNYKIEESNKTGKVKFYFACPEMERGYGGLDMKFLQVDETERMPSKYYPDLSQWDDEEDHYSNVWKNLSRGI